MTSLGSISTQNGEEEDTQHTLLPIFSFYKYAEMDKWSSRFIDKLKKEMFEIEKQGPEMCRFLHSTVLYYQQYSKALKNEHSRRRKRPRSTVIHEVVTTVIDNRETNSTYSPCSPVPMNGLTIQETAEDGINRGEEESVEDEFVVGSSEMMNESTSIESSLPSESIESIVDSSSNGEKDVQPPSNTDSPLIDPPHSLGNLQCKLERLEENEEREKVDERSIEEGESMVAACNSIPIVSQSTFITGFDMNSVKQECQTPATPDVKPRVHRSKRPILSISKQTKENFTAELATKISNCIEEINRIKQQAQSDKHDIGYWKRPIMEFKWNSSISSLESELLRVIHELAGVERALRPFVLEINEMRVYLVRMKKEMNKDYDNLKSLPRTDILVSKKEVIESIHSTTVTTVTVDPSIDERERTEIASSKSISNATESLHKKVKQEVMTNKSAKRTRDVSSRSSSKSVDLPAKRSRRTNLRKGGKEDEESIESKGNEVELTEKNSNTSKCSMRDVQPSLGKNRKKNNGIFDESWSEED